MLLLLFPVGVIGLFQLPPVRSLVLRTIESSINRMLLPGATFHIGDVGGTLWNTLSLENVLLVVDGDTLAFIPRIRIDYNIEAALRRHLEISKLLIDQPKVYLYRRREKQWWNYQRLVRPDTTVSTTTPWSYRINQLEIRSGQLVHIDERRLHASAGRFLVDRFQLDSLALQAQLAGSTDGTTITVFLKQLAFVDRFSSFRLRNATGTVRKAGDALEIFNAMVQSAGSSVRLNIQTDSLQAFIAGDQDALAARWSVEADSLRMEEFRLFLPQLPPGEGSVYLQAVGDLQNRRIAIRRFRLAAGSSFLQLRGAGTLATSLEQSHFTTAAASAVIFRTDLRRFFPVALPPMLRDLDSLRIRQLQFDGTPVRGTVEVQAIADAAPLQGQVQYDLAKHWYCVRLQFQQLNLQQFSRRLFPSTRLTGTIEGCLQGTTLENSQATLALTLHRSTVESGQIGKLLLAARYRDQRLSLDSLVFYHDAALQRNLRVHGWVYVDTAAPRYDVALQMDQLALQQLLPSLPFRVTAQVRLAGQGATVDDFVGQLTAQVDRVDWKDRSFLPFTLQLLSDRSSAGRSVALRSDFATVRLDGTFRWAALVHSLVRHSTELATYFVQSVRLFADTTAKPERMFQDSVDCRFSLHLLNAAYLQPLLPDFALWFQGTLAGRVIQYPGQASILRIDSLQLVNFDLQTATDTIQIFSIAGSIQQRLFPEPERDRVHIVAYLPYGLRVDRLDIWQGSAVFHRRGDSVRIGGMVAFASDSMRLALAGTVVTGNARLQVQLDTASVRYRQLQWGATRPVWAYLTPAAITFEQVEFAGIYGDSIRVRGVWRFADWADLTLTVTNEAFHPMFQQILELDSTDLLSTLRGTVRRCEIVVQGALAEPSIHIEWTTDTLVFQGQRLGIFAGTLRYQYQVWQGEAVLTDRAKPRLQLMLQQLPLQINFQDWRFAIDTTRPLYASVVAEHMPLAMLQPVLPFVADLTGSWQLQLQLSGYLPDRLVYRGEANIDRGQFLVPATNIRYRVEGRITFRKDTLFIRSLNVQNVPEDLSDGRAELRGFVFLPSFSLQQFDLQLHTAKLLVMSRATQAVNPALYGTLVLRTRTPLRLSGSLELPSLSGEIDVLKAVLFFPEQQDMENFQQPYCYERIVYRNGKRLRLDRNCPDELYQTVGDTTAKPVAELPNLQPSFLDRLHYFLTIHFRTSVLVTMDFSPFEQLVAELEAPEPLYYMTNPLTGKPEFYGELIVRKGSTYKFYRIFSAEGRISFRTGIDNPELDLVAELRGRRFVDQEVQTYRVIIYIQGTKKAPKLRFAYYINGEEQTGDPQEVQANSIFLILFGKTKAEFQQGSSDPQLASIFSSGISSGLSKFITEVLQSTGIIRSADIVLRQSETFGDWDLTQAEIRLRGEIAPLGVLWQYGGEVGDISRATFEINFPLGSLTNVEALRGLVVQIRRSVVQTQSLLSQQREYEIKVLYRYSW